METTSFIPKRLYVCAEQLLQFTPDKVFQLLCPRREYEWIEHWKCQIIYSISGYAEQDCIFTTGFSDDGSETWYVDLYQQNEKIQFVRFTHARVIRYLITLTNNNNGTTSAKWEQTITSLNDDGNSYIETHSDEEFKKMVKTLENMLNHYLATGQMLK